MKVAVYTIALNEERFVEKWYESAKHADYLLIADTGSSDGTVEKAKKLGINVFSISINPWRFDDARNASLALVPADIDYCIALDMDEVLLPGWRQELEKAHKTGITRPRYRYTWSWVDGKPGLQYGGDKIHKRQGYRWKHPVHEVIRPDRLQETQGWIDLEIHHYPDHTKSRGQYFQLLKLSVEEDPTDDRNTYYYARELFYNRMFDEAAEEFRRHLSLPKSQWPAERAASHRHLAKCEPANAKQHLLNAISTDPDRREAKVELALFAYEKSDWELCQKYALEALEATEKPLDYLCEDFAWGYLPYDLAALSSYHLGNKKLAKKYGKLAVDLEPKEERLKTNLQYYSK